MSIEQVTGCIRSLAIDTVQKANSGHPGAPMGLAPMANILFTEVMKYNPQDSKWFDRDRFVLSNGHASALIYTMLHLAGYKITIDDLKGFRQIHSITPGHPEAGVTDGVEVTTGPLGQGLANAVGMAIIESHLAATFNKADMAKIVDHHTFVICGDGCLMEGVAQEALSLGGHLGLHKLIVIYDDNNITIDGSTEMAFTENTAEKYRAMGYNIISVMEGNKDYAAMRAAVAKAKESTDKPTMIILKTIIGVGSKMAGTAKVHGSPLGDDDIKEVKKAAGRDPEKTFFVEDEVYTAFKTVAARGANAQEQWKANVTAYSNKYPTEYASFMTQVEGKLPVNWKANLPLNEKSVATRKASENSLGALMSIIPQLVGGSADLTGSNLTRPGQASLVDYQKNTPQGRYFRFGVREHGMCGIMNGMHAHGGVIPFGGTFLNFIGYALGSVRLAAMSHHHVIYVATHDSIGLGEDGPTHQPTDLLASLRALPNFLVLRPSDQTETSGCWALALERNKSPSCLCLTRQGTVPQPKSSIEGVYKGAYVLEEPAGKPQVILIGTGSEVEIAVKAAAILKGKSSLKVRVVSMPCQSVYDEQEETYKESVLSDGVPTVSIEAFHSMGWDKYSHYHLGLKGFGASAPAPQLYAHFGLTAENMVDKVEKIVGIYGDKAPKKRELAGL